MGILLSILTSNYNDGALLCQRLEQMLPAMPEEVEYLICDDASTDHSVEMISKVIEGYNRVSLLRNTDNQGVIDSANRLVRQAQGKYVYFSSANDLLFPAALFAIVPLLRASCAGAVVTDIVFHHLARDREDEYQKQIGGCSQPTYYSPEQAVSLFKSTFFWIPGSHALLRRDLVIKNGCLSKKIRHYTDFFLNHVLVFEAGALYIPNKIFCHYCVDETSFSQGCSYMEELKLAWKFLKMVDGLEPVLRSRAYRGGIFTQVLKKIFFVLLIQPKYWKLVFYMLKRKSCLALLRRKYRNCEVSP